MVDAQDLFDELPTRYIYIFFAYGFSSAESVAR